MVPADLQSSVLSAKKLYMVAATSITHDKERPECSGLIPRRARLSTDSTAPTKEVSLDNGSTKIVKIGGHLTAK